MVQAPEDRGFFIGRFSVLHLTSEILYDVEEEEYMLRTAPASWYGEKSTPLQHGKWPPSRRL